SIAGVTTFAGIIEGVAGENKIPSLYATTAALPSASTYHGMFAHVHATGRGYFAHAGNWLELVNKDTSGNVELSGDLDVDGHTNLDNVSIAGVVTATTFVGDGDFFDLDVDGHTNLDNVSIAGVTTMGGNLTISNATPILYFNDTGANPDYHIKNNNGYFDIVDGTNTATRLSISNTGVITISGNLNLNKDLDVDGHTNLDNVSIAGVSTFTGNADFSNAIDVTGNVNATGNLDLTD
ncbi:MAG: hypothetical protein VXY93_16045, partial [Pseudomonadota bacterium]|nr:hypothetical protein [Pseudomonadota bacterium]